MDKGTSSRCAGRGRHHGLATLSLSQVQDAQRVRAAIGAGHINIGDDDDNDETTYTSADIKLRYYPSAEGPTKFSAGIAFGYSRVTARTPEPPASSKTSSTLSRSASTSAITGCSGARDSFFIATGIGAKRLFPLGEDDDDDETFGYPTLRLSIGYAF